MGVKKTDFLQCNRYCKLTGLKSDTDEMVFEFYEIKDGKHTDTKVDYGTSIVGYLRDMYISSHTTDGVTYTNYNFVFEDDDGYFKLGLIMNKPCRKLINKLINADLTKELEISVRNSIFEIETKEKKLVERTAKNLTVKQENQVIPSKMTNYEMKSETEPMFKKNGDFDKTDFSLLDEIIIKMFEEVQDKVKKVNTPKTIEEIRAEVEVDKETEELNAEVDLPDIEVNTKNRPTTLEEKVKQEQKEDDYLPF